MKTGKNVFLALFALIIGSGMVFFGCDLFSPSSPEQNDITFDVTANNLTGTKNSDKLTINFSAEVTGLTKDDITLNNPGNPGEGNTIAVQKGNLTGSGKTWYLDITVTNGFAGNYSCPFSIKKDGISAGSKNVTIRNNEGQADYTLSSTKVENGASTLTITLTKDVSNLTASQINITETGATVTKGNITGGPKEYVLPLTGVTAGTITVKISNSDVNTATKSHELGTEDKPLPAKPTESITIIPDSPNYSDAVGDYVVEWGSPRKYTVWVTPSTASKDVLWEVLDSSIAEISQDGTVKAKSRTGGTLLTAKAKDGSGVGGSVSVTMANRIDPTTLSFDSESNLSDGGYNNSPIDTTKKIVTLYVGDKEVKLFTSLKDGNSSMVNAQDVVISPYPITSSNFKLTPQYGTDEATAQGVKRKQFILSPVNVTGSSSVKINFASDYKPSVKEVLTVKVDVKKVSSPTVLYYNGNTSLAKGDYKETSGKAIKVAIEPDAPYKKLELVSNSSIKKDGQSKNGRIETLTISLNNAFNKGGNVSAKYKVTDYGDKETEHVFTLEYSN